MPSKSKRRKACSPSRDTVSKPDLICPHCGEELIKRTGRFGPFLGCKGFPDCNYTKHLKQEDAVEEEIKIEQENCEKCDKILRLKRGKYGYFLACEDYPRKCKFTKAIRIKIGINCPATNCKGEVIRLNDKKGKLFYGCSVFPKCSFSSWKKPTGEHCPRCGIFTVEMWTGKVLIAYACARGAQASDKPLGGKRACNWSEPVAD